MGKGKSTPDGPPASSSPRPLQRVPVGWLWGLVALALLVSGCATGRPFVAGDRPFEFKKDTFNYANELVWEYHVEPQAGKTSFTKRQPPPDYALRCFVLVRSARQFFQNARFEPGPPLVDNATYQQLIRRVVRTNPRQVLPAAEKVAIPGYANLREFSRAKEALLKAECGGAWQSYLQRGHWRMVFPFNREHQERTAGELVESIRLHRPPVVHVVRFPTVKINHALLLFAAKETADEIRFTAYDPNEPSQPLTLTFQRAARRFVYPATKYFAGGQVDVHEVYQHWFD